MLKNEVINVEGDRHKARVESKVIEDNLKECTFILEIPEANPADVGNYTLVVKNEYGEVSTNVSDGKCSDMS